MDDEILFVAVYPEKEKLKEGFIQRIKEIDNLFSDTKRIYLDIRYYAHFKKKVILQENVKIVKLHSILHFFSIIKYINKAKRIYVHSVYSGFRIFPHIFFTRFKNAKTCLELHGTFQEELEYKGEKYNSKFFGWIEKELIKRSDIIVYVSRRFEEYFLKKYPFTLKAKRFVIPTCTSRVFGDYSKEKINEIIQKHNLQKDDVIFVYAGSTEVWQKIDIMMDSIHKLINRNPNYKFFLLTANTEQMENYAKDNGLFPNDRVFIFTVEPEELPNYYSLAHYGFVIRDDHILNEVSSPTKLLEYLYFGITPILKSTKLGDFNDYDIDYLTIDNLEIEFRPRKSEKNMQIAKEILSRYQESLALLKKEFLSE